MSNVYLFYVSFSGLGLGLGTAGLDYKTGSKLSSVGLFLTVHKHSHSQQGARGIASPKMKVLPPNLVNIQHVEMPKITDCDCIRNGPYNTEEKKCSFL